MKTKTILIPVACYNYILTGIENVYLSAREKDWIDNFMVLNKMDTKRIRPAKEAEIPILTEFHVFAEIIGKTYCMDFIVDMVQ